MGNFYTKALKIHDFFTNLPLDREHFLPRILYSIIALFLLYIIRLTFLYLFSLRVKNTQAKRTWQLTSFYISSFLYFLFLIIIWFSSLANLLTILSILGTGLIVVSKEVILNISGWFYIVIRKPFDLGNRVIINNYIGDILEIRLLDFVLIEVQNSSEGGQSTGKILHIPNALIFTHPLSNASKEFSFNWNEIKIPLTADSNWKQALEVVEATANKIIQEIDITDYRIREAENRYAIRFSQLQHTTYIDFQNGKIILYLRHLSEPRNIRNTVDKVWRELLTEFAKNKDIKLSQEH